MKPILDIQHISKKFKINHEQQPYLSLRDSLSNIFKSKKTTEDFWALKDVSFKVEEGDTVGIIGKNGAGKSTLLKILSKITPPTSGKIICRGRIASLLEVGTGFHPELSGRENIFMNGSILGMHRAEILKNFDAIVDFAGIEKFIDTPLKHYSSGMQLRLAFAVAAFLENEVLIIDEVLVVGDAEFQKKCMGKMDDVSKSGRTILFVSHNMGAVKQLCTKGVLISKGIVSNISNIDDVIKGYTNEFSEINCFNNGELIIKGKSIFKINLYSGNKLCDSVCMNSDLKLKIYFNTKVDLTYPIIGLVIKDFLGNAMIGINNKHYLGNIMSSKINKGFFEVEFPEINLIHGDYLVDVYFGNEHVDFEILKDCFVLKIDKDPNNGAPEFPKLEINKIFYKKVKWRLDSI
ncbi:MAG: ABC transporter ATP-binding protein [Bacteroidota bacterium]